MVEVGQLFIVRGRSGLAVLGLGRGMCQQVMVQSGPTPLPPPPPAPWTDGQKSENITFPRVATAQGNQGIRMSIFPDRENKGNLPKNI